MQTTNGDAIERLGDDRRAQGVDVVLRCFAEAVGADTAAVLTRTEGKIRLLSHWAREGHELVIRWTGGSLIARAFAADGPLLEATTGSGGAPGEEHGATAIAGRFRGRDRVDGVIYAGFSPRTAIDAPDLVWATESYSSLVALSLDREPAIRAVFAAASFDSLTGCLNHGGLLAALRHEIQRSQRHGHRLSLCFIDLDGFKRINDERGHLEGNRVLAAVGAALGASARAYDAVGRFGGDEFVVVLPETGGREAEAVAKRIQAVARTACANASPVAVDVSVGVAEWDRTGSEMTVLAAADAALARAKANGGAAIATAAGLRFRRADRLVQMTRAALRGSPLGTSEH